MIENLLLRVRALRWKSAAAWLVAAVVAYIYATAVVTALYLPDAGASQWIVLLIILLPGLLTMTLLRRGFRRWYRWAAVAGLVLTTYGDSIQVVLLVAATWALHRQWVTEAPAGIRANLRWAPPKPDPAAPVAVKKRSGKARKPKTA